MFLATAAGSMLDHHPAEGENPPPMNGSTLIVAAEGVEEIREILSKDIYATSGVWDLDNVRSFQLRLVGGRVY